MNLLTPGESPIERSGLIVSAVISLISLGMAPSLAQETVGIFMHSEDIGNPKHAGSATFDEKTQEYTVTGSGANVWNNSDEFHYLYNEISGDCIDSDNTTEGAVPAVGPDGEVYVAWSGPEGLIFDRSLDGGDTWLDNDIFIGNHPGGWNFNIPGINRCNGLPITCCDLSYSQYRGTIYVNWTDQRNGEDDTDVWIAKSTDGGD